MTYQEKVIYAAMPLFKNPDNFKEFLLREEAKAARYQASKRNTSKKHK